MELFNDNDNATEETVEEVVSDIRGKLSNGYVMNYNSLLDKLITVDGELDRVAELSGLTLTCGCGNEDCESREPRAFSVVRMAVNAMNALNGTLEDVDTKLDNIQRFKEALGEMLGLKTDDPVLDMLIYFCLRNNNLEKNYLSGL